MTLHEPFKISARLLPAVQIGNDWLSIEIFGHTSAGRTKYRFYLDTPNWEKLLAGFLAKLEAIRKKKP